MAQMQLIQVKKKLMEAEAERSDLSKKRIIGIQTREDCELFFFLTNKKSAKVYFSSVYKDIVLSFNFGNSKSFIIDRTSWYILKNNFHEIDQRFRV
jgi:hypothetical protein